MSDNKHKFVYGSDGLSFCCICRWWCSEGCPNCWDNEARYLTFPSGSTYCQSCGEIIKCLSQDTLTMQVDNISDAENAETLIIQIKHTLSATEWEKRGATGASIEEN